MLGTSNQWVPVAWPLIGTSASPSAWNKLATKPFRLLSAWIDIGGDQNSYPLVMFKIAIENGPFIVDFPMKNGGSFHSYVKLPEGKLVNITPINQGLWSI